MEKGEWTKVKYWTGIRYIEVYSCSRCRWEYKSMHYLCPHCLTPMNHEEPTKTTYANQYHSRYDGD